MNKNTRFKYPFLSTTLAIIALITALFVMGAIHVSQALGLLCLGQLALLACSRQRAAVFIAGLTPEQAQEMSEILQKVNGGWEGFKDRLKKLEEENDSIRGQLKKNQLARAQGLGNTGVRWIGGLPFVTDDCAEAICSALVLDLSRVENGLEKMVQDSAARQRVLAKAKGIAGITQRTALDSTTTPLPTIYAPQIIELVFAYGQARQWATVFPLGAGTVKLPRLKAGEDDFGYIGAGTAGMSQAVPEKRVQAELVTFTANKAGGIIRIPYELEEDTFIPIGQFLARYIARQLAKLEDKTMFIADGSGTYANITGIANYCVANAAYLVQLAAGKTKPSDATLADFRNLRTKVNAAVLVNMAATGQTQAAYYMHPSMEALLCTFNTIGAPMIYKPQNGNQPATLDGFPIRWIGVSQPYSTAAAAGSFIAFFGDLTYWFLAERGAPRVEVSKEVFFATDEIAMRALERVDVEAMAVDAMATLQTAAA